MSSPLDLLNKIIGAVIAYGPKNKTKKARKARKAAHAKKLIAVGTRVTSRPPHRTVRAQFGHTAPTLGA
jgi:hypothetical protein